MFNLSSSERTVVIFLVVTLLVGNVVLFIKSKRKDFAEEIKFVGEERPSLDEVIEETERFVREDRRNLTVDINTASEEELQFLPGIGPSIAKRIIDYRKNRRFGTKEEIMRVKGIGKVKYERLKDYIKVR